jgi:hypothetical protein
MMQGVKKCKKIEQSHTILEPIVYETFFAQPQLMLLGRLTEGDTVKMVINSRATRADKRLSMKR